MRKQQWDQSADTYLAGPRRKSKFRNAHHTSDALMTHGGQHNMLKTSEKTLQAVLATFLLDFFCDNLPINVRPQIKAELCNVMVRLKLIPSTFLSDDYSSIRYAFSGLLSNVISQALSSQPQTIHKPLLGAENYFENSRDRYQTDFIELEEIGRGGFARVHKVKSRIDNCIYAMKKIKIKKRFSEFSAEISKELQMLAQLDHKNIVRYHSGWVTMEASLNNCSSSDSSRKVTEIKEVFNDSSLKNAEARSLSQISDGKDGIYFETNGSKDDHEDSSSSSSQRNNDEEEESSDFMNTEDNPKREECEAQARNKFWANSDDINDTTDSESSRTKLKEKSIANIKKNEVIDCSKNLNIQSCKVMIYIQMELCTTTLSQFLIDRNLQSEKETYAVKETLNSNLEMQLLSAIEYIHSKHLIHRDIKPSNIFLKEGINKVRLLLGDFGLACVDNLEDSSHVMRDGQDIVEKRYRRSSFPSNHTAGVGTRSYAAPEQLNRKDYGHTVDIYSAGVVFLELYSTFATDMEKIRSITKLRDERMLPEALSQNWPTAAKVIKAMTEPDPTKRPSAQSLLLEYRKNENNKVRNLQLIIKNKDRRIEEQDELIKKKDEVISQLKEETKSLRSELKRMKQLSKP